MKSALAACVLAITLSGCVTGGPHSPEVAASDDRECQATALSPEPTNTSRVA
jgi:hypothetical protein